LPRICGPPDGTVPANFVRSDMEKAGFTGLATTLALATLLRNDFVGTSEEPDYNGEPYTVYSVTKPGMDWLLKNQKKLVLRESERKTLAVSEEDIPF
jgi:hypothetical protein